MVDSIEGLFLIKRNSYFNGIFLVNMGISLKESVGVFGRAGGSGRATRAIALPHFRLR